MWCASVAELLVYCTTNLRVVIWNQIHTCICGMFRSNYQYSQFNSGIAYLKKYLLQASQYWEVVGPIQGDRQLQTGYNIRSTFQTGLVPEWQVLWCPQSADFAGRVIVTNNSSRVYGIALFGIDKFDVELTKWNWVELTPCLVITMST